MSESTVAVVGSGIAATTITSELVARGHDVAVFEKGPAYPYPHTKQFVDEVRHLHADPALRLPEDLKSHTLTGDYGFPLEPERRMVVGGSATVWQAISLRMRPRDFVTRSRLGFGRDWPFGYDELEPFYGRAERLLGVSGTDEDNPSAPPRSTPYPLPPFELSWDDGILAERLERKGIRLHTTPQARTRHAYDGRDACRNFGTCGVCPIGARYSPNAHLERAVATGRCTVRTDTSVRRIVPGTAGGRHVLVVRGNGASYDEEHAAKVVIVAAGAIETSRLLLLSAEDGRLPALGRDGGPVGRDFAFHHEWWSVLEYPDALFPGRVGPFTGQIQQFTDPATRGRHGGIKVEFASRPFWEGVRSGGTREEIRAQLEPRLHNRVIAYHAETAPDEAKHVALSDRRDRFGDPFAHVHYETTDFDLATFEYAGKLQRLVVEATGAGARDLFPDPNRFGSGAHHMGGCRMGTGPGDGVTDGFGQVHGCPGVFVAGSSLFPGCSGPWNPTLTIVALALRTADHLNDRVL